MEAKEKAAGESGPDNKSDSANNTMEKPGKLNRMLREFANGAQLHRFEAERLGDHCLHSTVSGLQARYGISFQRERVKGPNRFGSETSVCRYWLSDDSLARAREIVDLGGAA